MKSLLCSFASILILCSIASNGLGAENLRLAYAVICDDPVLNEKVSLGVRRRLESANIEISDKFPRGKLFLYLSRDVNDRKNKDGVSIAISHVSNGQTALLALDYINKKQEIPDKLSGMLREEGFLKHLSVAHLDEASEEELNVFLDSIVATFRKKYQSPGS